MSGFGCSACWFKDADVPHTCGSVLENRPPRPAIIIECDKCGRKRVYARKIDKSIPARVARIVSTCDKCDDGDRGGETWYDARGCEVSQQSEVT